MPTVDSVSMITDDCEWVVEKAKEHLKKQDKHGARAWIITAKSLFSYRFIVQYEALKLHLACAEYLGAAQSLVELCTHFAEEEKLQSLVLEAISSSADAVQGECEREKMRKVFDLLPPPSQKKMLLTVADAIVDPMKKGRLAVATLRLFPDTALTLGLDVYDSLAQSFSRSSVPAADNKHRELLVTELLPILATSPRVIVEQPFLRTSGQNMALKTSHVCQWLEVAASFYTTLTVQELFLKKSHPCAGKTGWESLHQIFLSVCDKCGWIEVLHNKQIGPRLPSKVRWIGLQSISGYNPLRVNFEVPRGVAIACFYISVLLFFESAWAYYSYVHQVNKEGGSKCWALIEDIPSKQSDPSVDEKPAAKKRKAEPSGNENTDASITIQTGTRNPDPTVIESFVVAMDCWSFLHTSSTYRGEFSRLCQQWGALDWSWMSAFKIDRALYIGDHELYRKLLQAERQKIKPDEKKNVENLRVLLQLVNAYLLLEDSKSACNLATELISSLSETTVSSDQHQPSSGSSSGSTNPSSPKPSAGRLLKLICCTATDIVPYTLDIVLTAVKAMVFSDQCSDSAIGQLMVLSQYKWPKEMSLFNSLILLVQKRGAFVYTKFFDYVVTVEMLEEMMYLINQGKVKVNILPADSNSSKTQSTAITTRGVNNKAREELMSLMDRQLAKCKDNINNIIGNFFRNEKLCFIMSQ